MDETTKSRWGSAALVIAPAVLVAAFLTHPWIGNPLSPEAPARIAEAVAAGPTIWAVSHLLTAVGSGLLALAFLGLRGYLRRAGEDRWSAVGLPFVVMGSMLFALLPAMEFAPLAAFEAGLDIAAVQEGLDPWFPQVLLTGSLVFAVGAVCLAVGITRSGLLRSGAARVVAGALVVVAATRFVPLAVVLFYVQSVAVLVALWPLAYVMWTRPEARPAHQAPRVRG